MELVHETVNIKGWDICGSIDWTIGKETELPFEKPQPDKNIRYIDGVDKAGTKIMCIGEVVDGTVVDVYWAYITIPMICICISLSYRNRPRC